MPVLTWEEETNSYTSFNILICLNLFVLPQMVNLWPSRNNWSSTNTRTHIIFLSKDMNGFVNYREQVMRPIVLFELLTED